MSNAFVFPGQGSQFIGMGAALYDAFPVAREVFGEIDDALDMHLSKLIFGGEAEELTRTENAQPALMAVSLASVRVLEKEGGFTLAKKGACVAGHSLGEYSALAAAEVLGVGQAAKLLRLRGQAMQRAVPAGQGGMLALIGIDLPKAQEICRQAVARLPEEPVLEVANDNGGGQIVISGALAAIDCAMDVAKSCGIKRAVKLPVSAPFHCSLMAPAAEEMAQALEKEAFAAPSLPMIMNVSAALSTDTAQFKRLLVQQVTGTVRWRETIEVMPSLGITSVIELGAGKVLSGLVRRINADLQTYNAGAPEEIEALLKVLA